MVTFLVWQVFSEYQTSVNLGLESFCQGHFIIRINIDPVCPYEEVLFQ